MNFRSFVRDSFKGGHLYTFVGGGGKSSSIWAIGEALKALDYRVRISTTTKVDFKEFSNYREFFIEDESTMKKAILDKSAALLLVKGIWEEKGKYYGVENSYLESMDIPLDTIVLVEGDGAKRKPFKIPKSHEPVVPKNTAKLFVVIGSSIINEEIIAQNCYNIDTVLTLLEERKKIFSINNLLYLIEQGWLSRKNSIPITFLFNQSDLEGKANLAKTLSKCLWEKHGRVAIVISIQKKKIYFISGYRVSAIILSAGKSSRMGTVKCLLDYRGKTFLERAIELYGNYCQEIMIPIGYYGNFIKKNTKGLGFDFFNSRDYEEGIGGTLREAVLNLVLCDFFFVTFCDLPLVKKETLAKILKIAYKNQKAIVPVYEKKKGHPVLFPAKMRKDLAKLKGDLGAKKVLTDSNTLFVNVEDEGVITDIDTPEAYHQLGGEND